MKKTTLKKKPKADLRKPWQTNLNMIFSGEIEEDIYSFIERVLERSYAHGFTDGCCTQLTDEMKYRTLDGIHKAYSKSKNKFKTTKAC